MRIEAVPLGLALLATLAGCVQPTPYQPVVDGYGYSEQQIEDNRYWVRFAGNQRTPAATVQNYWLYRIAELTLDHGYDYFTVVDRNLERSTTYEGTAQLEPRLHHGGRRVRRRHRLQQLFLHAERQLYGLRRRGHVRGREACGRGQCVRRAERAASAGADHRGGAGGGAAHRPTAGPAATRSAAVATDLRCTGSSSGLLRRHAGRAARGDRARP